MWLLHSVNENGSNENVIWDQFLTPPNTGQDVEQQVLSINHCWWECKMAQTLWKTIWWFLIKLDMLLPYDIAVALLGIYPGGLKARVHTKTCMEKVIAALFISAKAWRQLR